MCYIEHILWYVERAVYSKERVELSTKQSQWFIHVVDGMRSQPSWSNNRSWLRCKFFKLGQRTHTHTFHSKLLIGTPYERFAFTKSWSCSIRLWSESPPVLKSASASRTLWASSSTACNVGVCGPTSFTNVAKQLESLNTPCNGTSMPIDFDNKPLDSNRYDQGTVAAQSAFEV